MNQAFKTTDAESYDSVAEAFNRLSETYSASFAAHLVELADLAAGRRVLDLACGAGVVADRVMKRGARYVGGDLSAGMLRVASSSKSSPDLMCVDAESLALRDGTFDAVISLFGFPHFRSAAVALDESFRVLKSGGVLAIAVGSPAPWPAPALGRVPGVARDLVRARRGLLLRAPGALERFIDKRLPSEPLEHRPPAAFSRFGGGRLRRLVSQAGFKQVRSGWRRQRNQIDSPEEFWELQAVFSSRIRKRLATAEPDAVAQLRSEFVARCQRTLQLGGELAYDVAALSIRAVRPQ